MKKLLVILLIFIISSCDEQDKKSKEYQYTEPQFVETEIEQIFGVKIGKKIEESADNIYIGKGRPKSILDNWLNVYAVANADHFQPKPEFINQHFTNYKFYTSYHFDLVHRIQAFGFCEDDYKCSEIIRRLGSILMKNYPSLKYQTYGNTRGKLITRSEEVWNYKILKFENKDRASASVDLTDCPGFTKNCKQNIDIGIEYRRNNWSEIFKIHKNSKANKKGYITFDLMSRKYAVPGDNIRHKEWEEDRLNKLMEKEKKLQEMVDPKGL